MPTGTLGVCHRGHAQVKQCMQMSDHHRTLLRYLTTKPLKWFSGHPGTLWNIEWTVGPTSEFQIQQVCRGLRFCMFNRFTGDAGTLGLGTTLWEALPYRMASSPHSKWTPSQLARVKIEEKTGFSHIPWANLQDTLSGWAEGFIEHILSQLCAGQFHFLMNPRHHSMKGVLPPHWIKEETKVQACAMSARTIHGGFRFKQRLCASKSHVLSMTGHCPKDQIVCAMSFLAQGPVLTHPQGSPDHSMMQGRRLLSLSTDNADFQSPSQYWPASLCTWS